MPRRRCQRSRPERRSGRPSAFSFTPTATIAAVNDFVTRTAGAATTGAINGHRDCDNDNDEHPKRRPKPKKVPAMLVRAATGEATRSQLAALVRHPDPQLRMALARIKPKLLDIQTEMSLATDPTVAVRRVYAQQRNRATSTDATLLSDPDPAVRRHAAWTASVQTLHEVASHSDPALRHDAISGWGVTAEICDLYLNDIHPEVRAAALRRYENLLPQTARRCVQDESPAVRVTLARRGDIPPDVDAALAADPDPMVRAAAAEREDNNPVQMSVFAEDPDPRVRLAAAQNPNTTACGVDALSTDPDPAIRTTARRHPNVSPRAVRRSLRADKTATRRPAARRAERALRAAAS